MYENIRNQICKNINEMTDLDLLKYIAHLAILDVELLDKFINFDKMKAYVDTWEKEIEKGE